MKAEIVFQQTLLPKPKAGRKALKGVPLSENTAELSAMFERAVKSPKWKKDPLLANLKPKTAKEILAFHNKVIADGRFVGEVANNPREVAKKLKVDLSDLAFETIKSLVPLPGDNLSAAGVVVAGGIAVIGGMAVATALANSAVDPRKRIVIDQSGIVKI